MNAVEIAIHVDFQEHRRVIRGPAHVLRSDAETKTGKIELIDEKVDHPDRVVFRNIIIQLRGKHRSLIAVCATHKARHEIPRRWQADSEGESLSCKAGLFTQARPN